MRIVRAVLSAAFGAAFAFIAMTHGSSATAEEIQNSVEQVVMARSIKLTPKPNLAPLEQYEQPIQIPLEAPRSETSGMVTLRQQQAQAKKIADTKAKKIAEAKAKKAAEERKKRAEAKAKAVKAAKVKAAKKAAEIKRKAAQKAKKALKSGVPVPGSVVGAGFGIRGPWSRYHTGLDFRASYGAPVKAVAPGRVVYAGNKGNWAGNHVVVRHSDGKKTLYAHLSSVSRRGGKVSTGTPIGRVGRSGRAFGAHLHLELYPAGARPGDVYRAINPTPWLRARGVRSR